MERTAQTLRKGVVFGALISAAVAVSMCSVSAAADKLGDVSDGSRAVPVHLIPLLDERGEKISLEDEPLMPFSTRQTCGYCHDVNQVGGGWHFNAADVNVPPGRRGQPWILTDAATATQIPISYRAWPGTYEPQQVGLSYSKFVETFGRQLPGGGPGELLEESDNPDEVMRAYVSGKLETNCLACHNAHPGQDQADYALHVGRQNYRWAAASASEFAFVRGSAAKMPNTYDPFMPAAMDDPKLAPPTVVYNKYAFDDEKRVLFDVVADIPPYRCYYCHSNIDYMQGNVQKWQSDEDVHIAAGLACVDCHRNGLDHKIIRGYEGERMTVAATCAGCHLGDANAPSPVVGRFAAPLPKHPGIPLVHFDKLTCTACHSGVWPAEAAMRTKTSRAHALGTLNSNKAFDMLPHLYYPVFARGESGKIGPHKLFWPAFWAVVAADDTVTPLELEKVRPVVGEVVKKDAVPRNGDWPALTEEQIAKILASLAGEAESAGKAGYIAGGKLYILDEASKLVAREHKSAAAFMWPIAHDVRPAAQSLGVRRCEDCHATDSPFFFGRVAVDSPIAVARSAVDMVKFQDLDRLHTKLFAFSFVFRPWLKVVALLSSLVIAGVLVLYLLKTLGFVAKVFGGED